MFQVNVNGKNYSCDTDKKLMAFLRDDLRFTSVKDGCSEGACGACTVLIDGKATRACIPALSKLENKTVVTVEGLTEREKQVYAYCFAEAGAVQCGFCIPGMVMSAKGLIDANPDPSKMDIKKAIRPNICRCTGYIKIEKAILMASEMFRTNRELPKVEFSGKIGEAYHRIDAYEKTLGAGIYVDDIVVEGMVYGKALRPKTPREKIIKIDITKAAAHPDCVGVITAKDVPGDKSLGHLNQDWDALIGEGETTRYIGDALALVATKHKETLDEVLSLIQVTSEVLPVVSSPAMALAEGAPLIHESGNVLRHEVLKRGNVEEAFKKAKHTYTQKYSTPFTDHAFMEPECAIAIYQEDDSLLLYTGSQSVYDEQREIAKLLGLPPEKVRSQSQLVGGGFGGKEDMSVQHHAALLAWCLKKAVKVKFSRQESILYHVKRHAMEIEITTACDENGILLGMKAAIISDTGAYASLGGPVLQRACTHAAGPYNYQNIDIDGKAVYTNNPPGGAFRGFGVTQSVFASECNLNKLAEMVGISPWEIRYRNAIEPGQVLPNGQIADADTAMKQTLLAVKDIYESHPYAGIACAMKNAGLGVGVPDVGRCKIAVHNGHIHIRTSAACIGQGMATVLLQIFCETTSLNPELVFIDAPDTAVTPNSGTTTASRQTVFTGEACRIASTKLNEALQGHCLEDWEGQEFYGEFFPKTDPMGSDKENPVSHVAYGYATQVVLINEKGELEKVIAAHDVGKAINPPMVEGQIEGGVVMGLGYALTEDFINIDGMPQMKYGTLGLLRSISVPDIECHIIENNQSGLAYGAKGVGEITTIPTAPAVQNAYYRLDQQFRTSLPLQKTFYKK